MNYVVTWVSDHAVLRCQIATSSMDEDEIFSIAEDEFEGWHGFRPTSHGFAPEDAEIVD